MSEQEYHKGKLKKVDLSQFDNDTEKYFEARYRYEFAADENRPNGMTEKEIQEAYQRSLEYKYRTRGAWEDLWFDNTDDYDQLIKVNGELWEVADVELDDITNELIDDVIDSCNKEVESYTSEIIILSDKIAKMKQHIYKLKQLKT